jgi:hypothetical protein
MSYSDYTKYSLDPTGKPRFFGTYKGIVKAINDPKNSNRLQVVVPQITGTDALDWAEPSLSGTVNLPSVGDTVWIIFQSGDTSYPVWVSGSGGSGSVTSITTAPTAVNTSATLATADMLNGIVTSTTAAAVAATLPSGTAIDAAFVSITGFTASTNQSWEWSVINTGGTNSVTVTGVASHTTVGNMVVGPGVSGRFTTRKTASATYVTYRIA